MELQLDQKVLTDAVAKAVITLIGGDEGVILQAFISDILSSRTNSYGGNSSKSMFEDILRNEIIRYTEETIRVWLKENDTVIKEATVKRLTEEEFLNAVTQDYMDNLLKKFRGY